MSYNLIEATDAYMTRTQFHLPRGQHYYPSESSVTYTDHHGIRRVEGQCLRQSWYRITGKAPPTKHDAYSEWIFALGRSVEDILTEQWKQMGIWVANNVKFYDPERNISGEVDVVLTEPDGTLYVVEVKSFYGYMATRDICGNKKIVGKPKTSQLLQALIYVDLGRRLGLYDYVKMVYYARDSASRNEFDIRLLEDGELLRPTINGVIDYRFTMDDIYVRFEELDNYIKQDEIPPRDYDVVYDPDKVKQLYAVGDIGKTSFEKWKKSPSKNPIGDWQCKYCGFSKFCWKENK